MQIRPAAALEIGVGNSRQAGSARAQLRMDG